MSREPGLPWPRPKMPGLAAIASWRDHGALTAAGAAYALPFLPADSERLNQLVDELRRTLGPAEFAAAVRHGASMRDAEIIGFVLSEIAKLQE